MAILGINSLNFYSVNQLKNIHTTAYNLLKIGASNFFSEPGNRPKDDAKRQGILFFSSVAIQCEISWGTLFQPVNWKKIV